MSSCEKFTTLATAHLGLRVKVTNDKEPAVSGIFVIDSLQADKTGKLANGKTGPYIMMKKEDDGNVTLNLHPDHARRMFTKGADSGMELVDGVLKADQTADDTTATDAADTSQAEQINAEAAALAAAVTTAAPTKAAKATKPARVDKAEQAEKKADKPLKAAKEAAPAEPKVDKRALRSQAAKERRDAEAAAQKVRADKRAADKADRDKQRAAEKEATKAAAATKVTKKDQAIMIFNDEVAKGNGRKEVIARYKAELDMGESGASTYYQNVQSGNWTLKTPATADTTTA